MIDGDDEEKDGDEAEEKETRVASRNNEAEKSDQLWASFLSDVGTRPKDSTPVSQKVPTVTVAVFSPTDVSWNYNVFCYR